MANPAMVAMMTEMGTTPSTMSTLETSRAPMCASSNASRKLPHWGSDGHSRPGGTEFDGWSAVVNRLTNGTMVTTMSTRSSVLPVNASRASDDHAGSSRVSRWMGSTVSSTSTMRTTASAEASPTWRPENARR